MQANIEEMRRELAALQRRQHVLEKQQQTTAAGAADRIVKQDRMVAKMQSLAGQIEQLNDGFSQIRHQGSSKVSAHLENAFTGFDKLEHLQQAKKLLETKNYEKAYHAYEALLQRSSKKEQIFIDALFGKAEVCFQWAKESPQGHQASHYKNAVQADNELLTQVPEKRRKKETPEILKRISKSLQSLGMTKEARVFQEELKRVTAKKL